MHPTSFGAWLVAVSLLSGCNVLYPFDDFRFAPAAGADAGPRDAHAADVGLDGALDSGAGADADAATDPGLEARAVSVGDRFTCAILTDDRIACWGEGTEGRVGTAEDRDAMGLIEIRGDWPEADRPTAVAAGSEFACAIVGADVYCWGNGNAGQLGIGTATGLRTAVRTMFPDEVPEQIVAGEAFACALVTGGEVYCWGEGDDGAIGNGAAPADALVPARVMLPRVATAIAAGNDHACAIVTGGVVYCWGRGDSGQLGAGDTAGSAVPVLADVTGAMAIDAGDDQTCAVLASGEVACWGRSEHGEAGSTMTRMLVPTVVAGISGATGIATGYRHTCAIAGGTVSCWGDRSRGQLGDGVATETRPTARPTTFGAALMAAGRDATCAWGDGPIRCWGWNGSDQLGTRRARWSVPMARAIPGPPAPAARPAIAGGDAFFCAGFGTDAWCWGRGNVGQLGNAGRLDASTPGPVSLGEAPLDLAVGVAHGCAVTPTEVLCWGNNSDGQTGRSSSTARLLVPEAVVGVEGPFTAVAAGEVHACALGEAGRVWCWGDNSLGQLGRDSASDESVAVVSGVTALDITAGSQHTCALLAGGTVSCWGANSAGQLGRPDASRLPTPAPVEGLPMGMEEVVAFGDTTCARSAAGEVHCWGDDVYGQLGDGGLMRDSSTPRLVMLSGLATGLFAGRHHACAIVGAELHCWGRNHEHQIDESTEDRQSPVRVSVARVVAGAATRDATCAMTATELHCWGSTDDGQQADGAEVVVTPARPVTLR